jgi:hypothetical protein
MNNRDDSLDHCSPAATLKAAAESRSDRSTSYRSTDCSIISSFLRSYLSINSGLLLLLSLVRVVPLLVGLAVVVSSWLLHNHLRRSSHVLHCHFPLHLL